MTPDDLCRIAYLAPPRISHDGSRILFVRKNVGDKNNYTTNLWCASGAGDDVVQFTSGESDSSGQWRFDDAAIAFIRTDKDKGESQIFIIPTTGGEAKQLTAFAPGTISSFKWSPDGKWIVAAFRETHTDWTPTAIEARKESGACDPPCAVEDTWYRLDGDGYFGGQRFELILINVASGIAKRLFNKDNLGDYDFDFSSDSKRLAVTANPTKNALLKPCNSNIYIVDVPSGRARMIPDLPRGPKSAVQWSPDGRMLGYAGREGTADSTYSTENLELWVCNPHKGRARSLTGSTDYCLMAITLGDTGEAVFGPNFHWHADSKRLITQIGWHGESHLTSIDAKTGKTTFLTTGACEHTLGNLSKNGNHAAVIRCDATMLPEVGIAKINKTSASVRMLTSFNRALQRELDLVKPTSHWIKSTDGNDVQVWVLRPKSTKKKMPAILEIHGGPHAQYGCSFFHEFQVLAAAGYAVFYSNPRGSKGYGRDHCHAIRGSWGDKDWVDMQAVITFMKKQPWVNTKRMGVMGGSYGGYMTNWIIGHTNEFAGAITDRCVSNLVSFWGNSDYPAVEDKYWQGNAWDKPEAVWKSSPIRYMGTTRTPTLIIHSEGDLRCNIEQSEQVFTLLKSKNVPTRFVRYPRSTSHGMSRMGPPDMRIHRLNEILDWWKEYLA